MNQVVIELGSNIEPERHIEAARRLLAQHFVVLAESQFVCTAPIGVEDQPDFINGALLIETDQEMVKLKQQLKAMESELGRVRSADKYAPRVIDLDIVVWNGEVVDPDFYQRQYLKDSVLELVPDLVY